MAARRLSAPEKLQRLLAVVPWVNGRGGATLDEIAARFDYPKKELQRDLLNVVPYVGAYPYTPDEIIEIWVDPETEFVEISYNQYFTRPLRLTAQQALALIGAASGVMARSDGDSVADGDNPLARGLSKLAERLGIDIDKALEVRLDDVDVELLQRLRHATAEHQQLKISYYSMARDSYGDRIIEPYSLRSADGHWYLSAWCVTSEGPRLFRVDRIDSAEPTGVTFDEQREIDDTVFGSSELLPKAVLDVAPEAGWIVDFYPVVSSEVQDNGRLLVTMAVAGEAFLERLLLQLGPQARVTSIDPPYRATAGSEAAANVLRRYRR